MQTGYTLRGATAADEPFLRGLCASARTDAALLEAWPEVEREAFLGSQFDLQRQQYEALHPDAEHDIVLCDGEPVGRLWVGWRVEEVRVLDVALLPDRCGRGLGSLILRDLQARAAGAGLPLRLHVEHANPGARRLYQRHGFREVRDTGMHVFMEWLPPPPATR